MKCNLCNKNYNEDKAADKFNEYFNYEYDYFYNGWEGYCAECAISQQEYHAEQEDDDYMPPFCRDCGNSDIYPDCRESCGIFDD